MHESGKKEFKSLAFVAKSTKESIMESIETTTQEMITIATLKDAFAKYLLLENYFDEETSFCMLLGRLELGLILRRKILVDDRKDLEELETKKDSQA
jgi:hypothetical protein